MIPEEDSDADVSLDYVLRALMPRAGEKWLWKCVGGASPYLSIILEVTEDYVAYSLVGLRMPDFEQKRSKWLKNVCAGSVYRSTAERENQARNMKY